MTTELIEEELRILSEALTSESEDRKIGEMFVKFFESPGFKRNDVKAEGSEYSYISYLLALKGEKIPGGPTLARNTATQIRSFAKRHSEDFPRDLGEKLEDNAKECDKISNDEGRQQKELTEAARIIGKTEHRDGIYAYTYPHYLKHPVIPSEDGITDARTFIKIGLTSETLSKRLSGEKTQMPQDPILLFFFKAAKHERDEEPELRNAQNILRETETIIHDHLKAIGHTKSSSGGGGKEWFLTNSDTIESTAKLMKLKAVYNKAASDNED